MFIYYYFNRFNVMLFPALNANLHDTLLFYIVLQIYIPLSYAIIVAAGNYMSLISAFSTPFEYSAALFHA